MTDTDTNADTSLLQEHRFPCDACGSDLRFDPGDHRLICDHCGNMEALETSAGTASGIKELDFKDAVANRLASMQTPHPITQASAAHIITRQKP